jgi:hypothetical protein
LRQSALLCQQATVHLRGELAVQRLAEEANVECRESYRGHHQATVSRHRFVFKAAKLNTEGRLVALPFSLKLLLETLILGPRG